MYVLLRIYVMHYYTDNIRQMFYMITFITASCKLYNLHAATNWHTLDKFCISNDLNILFKL